MISLIEAIFLGIIQGITEWLPISSSGHLAIVQNYLGIKQPVLFDIFLHIGTLVVIILVFYKEIIKILREVFRLNFKSEHGKLFLFIVIGSIPIVIVGYFFYSPIVSFFENLKVIGVALLFTGALLFFSEKFEKNKNLNLPNAILIGIMQSIALIPGVSRSGATISIGLLRGINKKNVVKFSFLLSIPAVIGAVFFEFNKVGLNQDLSIIIIGTLISVIVGYFSLKLLLKLIIKEKFHLFSYYCFIIGILLLIF